MGADGTARNPQKGLRAVNGVPQQRRMLVRAAPPRRRPLPGPHRCRKLDLAALRRIQRLEIFDEFEEWDLIQSHYCIALGIKDEQGALAGLRLLPR